VLCVALILVAVQFFPQQNVPVPLKSTALFLLFENLALQMFAVLSTAAVASFCTWVSLISANAVTNHL
jgi:hypothetical protein